MQHSYHQSYVSSDSMEKVQIYLSGRNLMDLDILSKSDPYVKVYYRSDTNKPFNYLGRTETVPNNLNPNFQARFMMEYVFEIKQEVKFEVYDEDDISNNKNDDFIGEIITTLGVLAGSKNQTTILDLKNPNVNKPAGKLIVRLQSCSQSNEYFQMKWKASNLMNTDSWFDWWDKSDPYLKLLKIRTDNTLIEVIRTQVIDNNLNPNWKQFEVSSSKLFSKNNHSTKVKVEVWDHQDGGETKHQFIGQAFIDLSQLRNASLPITIELTNRKHKKPGVIILQKFNTIIRPTFVDYLRGGLELNLSVCIDFTGSNGIPTLPSSLHYFSYNSPNQYQMAIECVSNILLDYDSDKRIPAYGFGAKPRYPTMNSPKSNNCFPLSGDYSNIQAFGKEHLMQLYNYARSNVQLAGPTYFAPLLTEAIKSASISAKQGSMVYQILLILTDGQIHDMDQTIDLIVDNCLIPLSIIIVGVGDADFANMVRLDGDNGLYDSKGRKARRDIVQFVPFRQVNMNPDMLARQLLAELPKQVTDYMALIGKKPGQPIQPNIEKLLLQNAETVISNQMK